MNKMRFLMPLGALLIVAAFSVVVMLLWNWLMPAIFGLTVINFWQAIGILILSRILFGSFGIRHRMQDGMKYGMHNRNHLREKWMEMTPEERKEFIKKTHAHRYDERFDGYGQFNGYGRNVESEDSFTKQ
jgi:ABC-type multidrug transport system fused ATPase/permease subunit